MHSEREDGAGDRDRGRGRVSACNFTQPDVQRTARIFQRLPQRVWLTLTTAVYIGTGASVIYPLLGAAAYGWKFIGSECNPTSFAAADRILKANAEARPDIQIELRLQPSPSNILEGVLAEQDTVDFVMCNPPFFDSPGHPRCPAFFQILSDADIATWNVGTNST